MDTASSSTDRSSANAVFQHEDHKEHEDHKAVGAQVEGLARIVVDCAIKVHRVLGPGLLESIYEQCLAHELRLRRVPVARQVILPVAYDGLTLDGGYRLDLLVGASLIVEVKAVETLSGLHEAQTLTYLKLSGHRLALLINFNVKLLKDGVRRFVR